MKYVHSISNYSQSEIIEKGNIKEKHYYLGGYEIYRRINSGTLEVERESLFIEDGTKTIAQIDDDGTTQTIRYQYDNHLGSASLELDETGDIISYEEYHPFGTTSYRSGRDVTEVSLKRYKYVGKERDNETGLYYYGARYYGDWIARFISVDPLQHKYPHYTPYQYAGNKPVTFIDLDGMEEDKPNKNNQITVYNGDKRFDDFVNSTIEQFGFSENYKVTVNINNVEGEFVGGSVSVTENGKTKTINYSPSEGFSDVSISFESEVPYKNFEAETDNTNVILPKPVVLQANNKIPTPSYVIPNTEIQQLGPDRQATWTEEAKEQNFRIWDNQRKINEHKLNLHGFQRCLVWIHRSL